MQLNTQTAMALPYEERPVGTTPPSCDLSFLIRHLFPQGCFPDGFVTIMMRDPAGKMHRVTTKPASLLPEFCERSLYFGKRRQTSPLPKTSHLPLLPILRIPLSKQLHKPLLNYLPSTLLKFGR